MAHWSLIFLLIAALIIAAFFYIQTAMPHPILSPNPTAEPTAATQGATQNTQQTTTLPLAQERPPVQNPGTIANWRTYQNTEFGFAIKYPNKFTFEENPIRVTDAAVAGNIVQFYPPHLLQEAAMPVIGISFERHDAFWERDCADNGIWGQINGIDVRMTGSYQEMRGLVEDFFFCSKENQRQPFIFSVDDGQNGASAEVPDVFSLFGTMVGTFKLIR